MGSLKYVSKNRHSRQLGTLLYLEVLLYLRRDWYLQTRKLPSRTIIQVQFTRITLLVISALHISQFLD